MKIYCLSFLVLLLFACNNKQHNNEHNKNDMKIDTGGRAKTSDMDTMNDMSKKPEADTMRGMANMLPMNVKKDSVQKPDEISLSEQQVQLGNIQTDTLNSGMLGDRIILTATLNINQIKTTSISARVMGRIEKLYFKNIGDYVIKGERLYDLYSEDLNNAKQELIQALDQKNTLNNSIIDFDKIIQSAKYKLMLWGMSRDQIEDLVNTRKTTTTTTFYSNSSGYINTLEIKEGDYTMEGSTIIRLADLSTLWVEAQVYSSQLSQIDKDGIAIVQIPDMPGKRISGKIEFVNPEINPDTRINLIRVTISNPGNQLKPGMPAYVFLKKRQHNTLSLPINAVLRDGKGARVWIQTGKNTYESRMVEVGMETGELIEIKSGVKAGDIIVTSGAYLINSEYIFRKGANPMGGMKM